jgi:hypothetical protein
MATFRAFAGDHHHGATIERFPDGNMRVDPADDSTVIGVNPGVKVENDHSNVINGVTPGLGTAHNLPDGSSLCTGGLNC